MSFSIPNFVRKVLVIRKMFCMAYRCMLVFYFIILGSVRPPIYKNHILSAVRTSVLSMFVSIFKTSRSFRPSNLRTRNDTAHSNLRKVGRFRPGNNGICVSRTDLNHLMESCQMLSQTYDAAMSLNISRHKGHTLSQ